MSRIYRLVVLVASVAAVVSAMAGTAGAVTWHVSGSGAFTATAPAATLVATGSLACPAVSASGTYATGSHVGTVYNTITGLVHYGGCSLAGQSVGVTCGYRLTGLTQPAAGVVTGNVDVTCGVTLTASGTKLCHIQGSPHAVYTDTAGADTLTITTSQLTVGGSTCTLGTHDTAHLPHQTFTVTTAGGGPQIVRTA